MRPFSLLAMVILLFVSSSVVAEVIVTAPAGDIDPAFLAELKASIEEVAAAEAPPECEGSELRASANASEAGVALDVVLVPADGSSEIRELRVASRASALAQARAMARSVVRMFAERTRAQAGPAPAPQEIDLTTPPPSPIDLARTAARPGIALGLGLDIAGFLGVAISLIVGIADSDRLYGAFTGITASGGAVVIGSFVSTMSHTVRHAAYREAGLHPRPNKPVLSWFFTTATIALYTVSIVCWLRDAAPENDVLAGLNGAVLSIGAIKLEAVNLGIRAFWRRELRRSEKQSRPSVAVSPFMAPSGARSDRPIAGLAAVVQF